MINNPPSSITQAQLDLKAPLASPTFTGTVAGITKSMVGLGNVDNTSDATKPISTATQTALDNKTKTLFDYYTDVTVGGAETDIYSSNVIAGQLANNGEKLTAQYGGNFVTGGTELCDLEVYFGGSVIWDSTGVAPSTGTTSWRVWVEIIRVSASVIRYTVSLNTTGASGFVYAKSDELTGLTLSNANILKITGTSSGVGSGSGDIIGKMGFVEWRPAA